MKEHSIVLKCGILIFFLILISNVFQSEDNEKLYAHGGGTDKCGCHTNRKTGEYHCHTRKQRGGDCPPEAKNAEIKQALEKETIQVGA